ncbi:hypothetical protein H3C70_03635 [Patescibacteria group bacterium]|nr:hypothetical protein [Patescibacteria group bacterium]
MTDAAQAIPAVTPTLPPDPAGATQAPSDQSPLDILDQILKDAQNKAATTTDQKLADDERLVQEEQERQRQLDAQKVQEELQQIEAMKSSPQYQAMMQQKQEVEHQKEEHQKQMTGMEILQLEHTKA